MIYKIFHSNGEFFSSSIFFFGLPHLTWGNCYNWCYWTGFSCMKHHLCWHNEQEFSAQNDDFLPAHIWHNLVLDASHHVTVMGPRLKSEQQRTYLCCYTILSSGERRHCATHSYRHHFTECTILFYLSACLSCSWLCLSLFLTKTCSFRSIVSSSPAATYPFSPPPKKTHVVLTAICAVIFLNFPPFDHWRCISFCCCKKRCYHWNQTGLTVLQHPLLARGFFGGELGGGGHTQEVAGWASGSLAFLFLL